MPIEVYNATESCVIPIKTIKFPAGETLVNLDTSYIRARNRILVTCRYKGQDDLFNLLQVADILHGKDIHLYLPYVPAARQDRRANPGDSHTLKVVADMINSAGFKTITVDDPHSDVVEALFPHAIIQRQWNLFKDTQPLNTYDVVVAPDAGAVKKASKIADFLNVPLMVCTKERDPVSGALSHPRIQTLTTDSPLNVLRVLVVDDICDGGYTFVQLAHPIKERFPTAEIDLWVTHGIFSKGLEPLHEAGYSNVFSYNQIYGW